MPRAASSQPTDGELELLKLLWSSGPADLGSVCAALRKQRPVATTTVATMLKVMLNKGLVRRAKRPGGYVWSARVSARATRGNLLRKLIDRVFDGSASLLVAHLVDTGGLSEQELSAIRALVESRQGPPGGCNGPAESGPPS